MRNVMMEDCVSGALDCTAVGGKKMEGFADVLELVNGDIADEAPQVINSYVARLVEGCFRVCF